MSPPPDSTAADQPTGPYPGELPSPGPSAVPATHRIGRFEVRAVLGKGSFGVVFRAYDPQLDREVALKVPRLPRDRPDLVERFLREARVAAGLRHPGIVAVFEAGQVGNLYFIASEFVTGATLRQCVEKERPTLRQAAAWVRDLALALEYAHGQGVIHRDVKPGNIMIDTRNRPQLTDFGLAKRFDVTGSVPLVGDSRPSDSGLGRAAGDALVTADGAVLGTPAYMSPEQARGAADAVGPHSDQYSLGVVLYELLTGHQPFEGSVKEVLRRAADPACAARSPRALNPEVPAPLAAVCLKAVAKSPSQRYGSAAELAVDLQRWLNDEPVRARRGSRRRPKKAGGLAGWCRRHLTLVLAVPVSLVLVGLLAGGASWFVVNLRREAEASRQESEAARHNADNARCDLSLERGRGKDSRGLRWLAESGALALELGDARRQQAAADLLAEEDRSLDRPPGMDGDAGLRWDLAAHLLLGRQLPQGGAWEALGERLAHPGSARLTGFGADGQTVLTADSVGDRAPVPFRDARSGEPFGQPVQGRGDAVLIPGGQRVLRLTSDFWTVSDLASGQVLGPKYERDWRLHFRGSSPDGTKLVVSFRARQAAQVWDVTNVRALTRPVPLPEYMQREISAAAVNNDGSCVALATPGTVYFWTASDRDRIGPDETTGQQAVRNFGKVHDEWKAMTDRPEGGISSIAFHPDGRHVLVAGRDQVGLWDSSGERVGDLLPAGGVKEMVVNPQGGQVLTRGADGSKLWDVHSRRPVGPPLERLANVQRLAFGAGGRQLLTAADGDVRLWPNPVVAPADRPAALRLWAQAATGFEVDPDGDLRPLDPAHREECGRRFARLAGLAP
jgi:predicted Ser/Thr protein kinase